MFDYNKIKNIERKKEESNSLADSPVKINSNKKIAETINMPAKISFYRLRLHPLISISSKESSDNPKEDRLILFFKTICSYLAIIPCISTMMIIPIYELAILTCVISWLLNYFRFFGNYCVNKILPKCEIENFALKILAYISEFLIFYGILAIGIVIFFDLDLSFYFYFKILIFTLAIDWIFDFFPIIFVKIFPSLLEFFALRGFYFVNEDK